MHTTLLAIAKDEYKNIEEWLDWHFNLGFDKIILIINEELNDKYFKFCEKFKSKLELIFFNQPMRFLNSNKKIVDSQSKLYTMSIDKIEIDIDWLTIIDLDEFIEFKDGSKDIHEFIKKYNNGNNVIELYWETYDDNDLIFESEESNGVINSYTRILEKPFFNYGADEFNLTKCIFKYNRDTSGLCAHGPTEYFNLGNTNFYKPNKLDKSIGVIRHYRTKCLEYYIKHKILKCKAHLSGYTNYGNCIFTRFFSNKSIH